jgi:polyisoprenoid-binding protein YceI
MRNFAVMLFAVLVMASALGARTMPVDDNGNATQPTAGTAWEIDPAHSSIVWTVGHNNGAGKVYGRFNSFSGTIIADAQNPANSQVDVTVEATSVDTAVPPRDEHLRTKDFFNVEQFPQLSFSSTQVEAGGEAGLYNVTGELSLLGQTQVITIPVKQLATATGRDGSSITGFESSFTIQRSKWGMGYGIPGLSDDIQVMLAFECKGPAPAAADAPKPAS